MIRTGDLIGNYKIISQLGSDSFSTTYLAEHTYVVGPPVAVKYWSNTHLHSSKDYNAFLHEAQALIGLRHPYILSTIDYGVDGEIPYIVTENPNNTAGTLRQRKEASSRTPLPPQSALSI